MNDGDDDGDNGDANENALLAVLEKRPAFERVTCCGQRVGMVNTRPFTPEATARFEEIRQRNVTADDPMGNGWTKDPDAKALISDPRSYGPVPDGHRFAFTCPTCGASFVQAGGALARVPVGIS